MPCQGRRAEAALFVWGYFYKRIWKHDGLSFISNRLSFIVFFPFGRDVPPLAFVYGERERVGGEVQAGMDVERVRVEGVVRMDVGVAGDEGFEVSVAEVFCVYIIMGRVADKAEVPLPEG